MSNRVPFLLVVTAWGVPAVNRVQICPVAVSGDGCQTDAKRTRESLLHLMEIGKASFGRTANALRTIIARVSGT
jgi:hypothetical protein